VVPERARRFLSYIVEESLAGRADRIKAFSIATDVLGRGSSFDGSVDPVVRIEAGRVRRALEHYYLVAGADDPIIIMSRSLPVVTPTAAATRFLSTKSSGATGTVSPGHSCWWLGSLARA